MRKETDMSKVVITPQTEEVLTLVMVNGQLASLKIMLEECLDCSMYLGDSSRELIEETLNDVLVHMDKLRDIFDEVAELGGEE